MRAPLPIDSAIPDIIGRLDEARAVVITAAPGAGKTTRVPPALAGAGRVIVLQPRRVAVRSIAARIAAEQEWTPGREVGWHVRFERRFAAETRILLATEGILTARLQQDPLLSDFTTIVLDEFHERSIHADLAIALAKQAWLARSDLRLVVMSATIDAGPVAAYLNGCPVVDVPGDAHPLRMEYRPGAEIAAAVQDTAARGEGQILCFLQGAPEIRRTLPDVARAVPGIETVELHGSLDAAAQDAALAPVAHRRVILATNIAETSLTVPGVRAVIDTGLHKVARYDPDRGIDSLETERISQASADQRAGRAARLGPGIAIRLWHQADRLRAHREPDIHRVDLAGPLLDVLAWGGDPHALEWFEAPRQEAIDSALGLLGLLGAVQAGRLTPLGARLQRLPLHPRLARILIASGGSWSVALACAVLSERHFVPTRRETTSSDLLSAVERERDLPPHVVQVARELQRGAADATGARRDTGRVDEGAFRRAIFLGYADRVARRRDAGSSRVLLASGHGAVILPESGVRDAEFLVALDVTSGRRGEGAEARIRLASAVDRDWLEPTDARVEHEFDAEGGRVRAIRRDYYGAIVLTERPVPPDPDAAARVLRAAYEARGPDESDVRLLRRLEFAGVAIDGQALLDRAVSGRTKLSGITLIDHVEWADRQRMESLAPDRLSVPSGRSHRVEYHDDGSVSMAVKLQELFGLAETPRIGPRREPVLIHLLAPNGRPVQTTRDLRSFWQNTYPEVRKELRGRYPKHPWPDDPWTAEPAAGARRKGKG